METPTQDTSLKKTFSFTNILLYIVGFIIGKYFFEFFPAPCILLLISIALWLLGKWICNSYIKPKNFSPEKLSKNCFILSLVGLLGVLSPALGFLFALPAYLIATELLPKEFPQRKSRIILSSIIASICVLNAMAGAYASSLN